MEKHVKILGIIFIICGILGIIASLGIMILVGPFAISKVAEDSPELSTFAIGFIVEGIGFLAMLVSVIKGVAGIALLKRMNWGWVLGLLAAVLSLFNFPIGTAIGVYGLWVLFQEEVREMFDTIERTKPEENTE